jgi:hydrogenase nickel incorporation protein HypA/HybF
MHELAVCQDIIAQVEKIAQQHNALAIFRITLDIGPLSGVEPALLQAAFPIACAGTVAENALLEITEIPVTVECNSCRKTSTVSTSDLTCQHCGNWQTRLVSGDEMLLKRIEMDT